MSMSRFQVGHSYAVWHIDDDTDEVVTIADRTDRTVTLTDGRKLNLRHSLSPDGSDSESFHLRRDGRANGVCRVCHDCTLQMSLWEAA